MREYWEFRIREEHAHRIFAEDEGERLGQSVRKVLIAADDPRFPQIGRLEASLRAKDDYFFAGNYAQYRYTKREIEYAELFHLNITAAFEPAGELCGTRYDESDTCPACGAGRRRESDLILDLRKAPKTKDIACTIARDEVIVSQRLAELMVDAKLTGFDLGPVRHKARYQDDPMDLAAVPSGRQLQEHAAALGLHRPEWGFYVWLNRPEQKALLERADAEYAAARARRDRRNWRAPPVWYQLVVTSARVPIVPPTRTGIDPFDDDAEDQYRCPYGHVIGLNLLSEVSVDRSAWDGSDVACTSNMVGDRRGLLVPTPCILISPRFYRLLRENRIRGYKNEVAYLL